MRFAVHTILCYRQLITVHRSRDTIPSTIVIFASSKMTETCGRGIDDFQIISCKGLCRYLKEKKISQDVIQVFCDQRV